MAKKKKIKKQKKDSKKKPSSKEDNYLLKESEKKSSPKLDIEEILEEFDEPLSKVSVRASSPSLRQINISTKSLEFEEPEERHQEKKPERELYARRKSDYSENSAEEKKEYDSTQTKTPTKNPVSESSHLSLRQVNPINSEINQWEQKEKDYSVENKRLEKEETNSPFNIRKDYHFS